MYCAGYKQPIHVYFHYALFVVSGLLRLGVIDVLWQGELGRADIAVVRSLGIHLGHDQAVPTNSQV